MKLREKSESALEQHRKEERIRIDTAIRQGLEKIKSDPTKKRTLKELANQAGIATQTLRRREWPIEAIEALKTAKKRENQLEELAKKERAKSKKKENKELMEGLAEEIGYWFKETLNLKAELESTKASMNRYKKSQEIYINELNALTEKHEKLVNYLNDFHGIDAEHLLKIN